MDVGSGKYSQAMVVCSKKYALAMTLLGDFFKRYLRGGSVLGIILG